MIVLTIISLLGVAATIVAAFMSWRWSALSAFATMLLAWLGGLLLPEITAQWPSLIFWGACAAMVIGLNQLLPAHVVESKMGNGYVVAGAIIGALVGVLLHNNSAVVLATVIGTALGALAYSRTPAGRPLQFPSSKFVHYLCAKGFPAVVAIDMLTLAIDWAIHCLAA